MTKKRKKLIIFDLDDTLIKSDAQIKVFDSVSNELIKSISPSQFNYQLKKQEHYFCFGDFDCEKILGKSTLIHSTFRSLKRYYRNGEHISIITARSDKRIILDFFETKNISLNSSLVYTIHSRKSKFTGSISQRKKQAIEELIKKGYKDIKFYEDNLDNIRAAEELNSSDVTIKTIHVNYA